MRFSLHNDKGFSLLELLTVVAIVAILAGLASLGMDFVRRERLSSATRTLLADLQKARMEALTMRNSSTAGREKVRGSGIIFTNSSSYSLFLFNDNNPENYSYDGAAEATNMRTINLPASVELTLNGAVPNNETVIFDRFGMTRRAIDMSFWFNTLVLRHRSLGTGYRKCISVIETRIREGYYDASGTCNES